jgi:deoxyribonuclease-1
MMRLPFLAISLLSSCFIGSALANGQSTFDDPEQVRSNTFWKVYPSGGTSLYCGEHFDNADNGKLVASPAYNVKQIKSALRCLTDTQCTVKTPRYPFMLSDLHNFFPASADIESKRRNAAFGELEGSSRQPTDLGCNTKATYQIIETRDEVKGDIARAMLYMHVEYMLSLKRDELALLKKWNQMDPPDAEEKQRNERIAQLQGNRNRFIDDPKLADALGK